MLLQVSTTYIWVCVMHTTRGVVHVQFAIVVWQSLDYQNLNLDS